MISRFQDQFIHFAWYKQFPTLHIINLSLNQQARPIYLMVCDFWLLRQVWNGFKFFLRYTCTDDLHLYHPTGPCWCQLITHSFGPFPWQHHPILKEKTIFFSWAKGYIFFPTKRVKVTLSVQIPNGDEIRFSTSLVKSTNQHSNCKKSAPYWHENWIDILIFQFWNTIFLQNNSSIFYPIKISPKNLVLSYS